MAQHTGFYYLIGILNILTLVAIFQYSGIIGLVPKSQSVGEQRTVGIPSKNEGWNKKGGLLNHSRPVGNWRPKRWRKKPETIQILKNFLSFENEARTVIIVTENE